MSENYLSKYISEKMLQKLIIHKCTACGLCCKWDGHVFIYVDDVKIISKRLNISREKFISDFCQLITWVHEGTNQYRVVLKKDNRNECMFLKNNLCSIHDFKPLACTAGPVGSHFIFNQNDFWYYVKNSPCFRNNKIHNNIFELDKLFLNSWVCDFKISSKNSFQDISKYLGVNEALLKYLPIIILNKKEK